MKHNALVSLLRAKLGAVGLKTFIIRQAASGSCYLRFEDERMGKIRVGDHDERTDYGYRWQIRADIKLAYTDELKKHKRFFYPPFSLDHAVEHMLNYQRKIISDNTPPVG